MLGRHDAHGVVVMGVSGSGKSTVGALLAARLGGSFVDADDLHPPANVAKMSSGEPLTDGDREPWLTRVGAAISRGADAGTPVVTACSALRRRYRDTLRAAAGGDLVLVHLTGDRAVLHERTAARADHFMPTTLLDSQLATLEPLEADETGMTVAITDAPDVVVEQAATWILGAHPGSSRPRSEQYRV
ncbi:gluconokinase [Isoptericola aurantiacus]|uniref:gluconokinase n=1 Tax=Isoptericola aurantiacus TaxID=3377839 RepID=UPI00383A964D